MISEVLRIILCYKGGGSKRAHTVLEISTQGFRNFGGEISSQCCLFMCIHDILFFYIFLLVDIFYGFKFHKNVGPKTYFPRGLSVTGKIFSMHFNCVVNVTLAQLL